MTGRRPPGRTAPLVAALLVAGLWTGLSALAGPPRGPAWVPPWPGTGTGAGRIADPQLTEASGLAASGLAPGRFWAVNDSGNRPILFALDASGRALGRIRVEGVLNRDWEALAQGPCPAGIPAPSCLYIADVGDNPHRRDHVRIEILVEPDPDRLVEGAAMRPARTLTVRWQGGPRDCEALLVHPRTGALYLIEKTPRERAGDGAAIHAVAPPGADGVALAGPAGRLSGRTSDGQIAGPFTDAAFLPDGRGFAVRDYRRVHVGPWPPDGIDLRLTAIDDTPFRQAEALAVAPDGRHILLTSEGRNAPIRLAPLMASGG